MESSSEVKGDDGLQTQEPVASVASFLIQDLQYRSGVQAHKAGFRDDPKHLPELIALMHSELSEALEEYRNHHGPKEIYFTTDKDGLDKPEGIAVELSDCVIRIMHWFYNAGMDLGAVCDLKLQYNAKRPFKHGGKLI